MNRPQQSQPYVYDILARTFLQEGIATCFGLLGDANMYWAARLAEAGCRFVYVRHEHCAVGAATAYARVTGEVGVATVTCGPGLTQTMTALSIAVRARIPLVVFAGEAPVSRGWYNQVIDQAPFVLATGADYHRLHWAERMPVAVRDAFVQARRERRPVVLGVPFDLQELTWSGSQDLPAPSSELTPATSPMPPNPDDVKRAADRIDAAERIVVMAGLGAVDAGAGPACRALAERCGGLVAESLPARGFFRDDPHSLGIAGGLSSETARGFFVEADLIVAVGCSLGFFNADAGRLWPKAEVLQVDTDPIAINQGRVAAQAHLRADARLGVEALSATIAPRSKTWRSEEVAARLAEGRAPVSFPSGPAPDGHDPSHVVAALDQALPDDWFIVNTSGHISAFTARMPSRRHDRFLTIREFGAIGNGTAFAIGVAAARPDCTVVLIEGDGSFLMHLQELETIKRHNLNILSVVVNDGAYGSEIHKLRAHNMTVEGALFGRPDFGAIGKVFGLGGQRVDDLAFLTDLVADFAKVGGGAVWDIPTSDKIASARMRGRFTPAH